MDVPHPDLPRQEAERYYEQALGLYDQERYLEALSVLDRALSLDRDNPYLWYTLGNTYYALRGHRKAAAAYLRALRRAPYMSDAALNLGVTYEVLGFIEKSLALYERASQTDAGNGYVWYNRGNALAKLRRFVEARDSFEKAIQLLPQFAAGSFLNRGHVLSQLGRHDDALEDYRRASFFDPQDSNIAFCLAWAQFGKDGLTERDERSLKQIPLDPAHYTSHLCLGVLELRKNVKVALRCFERAKDLQPQEWDPHFWIGVAAALSGELEIARHAIDFALDVGLPPMLLTPLYWFRVARTDFYESYAQDVLQRFGI